MNPVMTSNCSLGKTAQNRGGTDLRATPVLKGNRSY